MSERFIVKNSPREKKTEWGWEQYERYGEVNIIVDRKTGVNYLFVRGGGVTPLLDADGKLVITKE